MGGSDGLETIDGLTGYNQLVKIGYTSDYIRQKLDDGFSFRLVTFDEGQKDLPCKQATWEGVLEVCKFQYPQAAAIIEPHLGALKSTPFEDIKRQADFDFAKADLNGSTDEHFMTQERLLASDGGLIAVRAFLYHVLQIRTLFAGDGYTRMEDGSVGLKEYLCPNLLLERLVGLKVTPIDVVMPSS